MSVDVCIAGAGYMTEHHIQALLEMSDVSIVGICSRGSSAEALMSKYGLSASFSSVDAMLADCRPDCIFVCVSHLEMEEVVARCLGVGCPVFIEKPAAMSTAGVKRLSERACDVRTMVGVNRRFMSNIVAAKTSIDTTGGLEYINVEAHEPKQLLSKQGMPASVLDRWHYANGVHCIDLLRYLGGDHKRVMTMKPGVALIEFQSGAVGHYVTLDDIIGRWSVSLANANIRVEISPLETTQIHDVQSWSNPRLILADGRLKPGIAEQDAYFIENVVKKGFAASFPASDIHDHLRTFQLIDAILDERNV